MSAIIAIFVCLPCCTMEMIVATFARRTTNNPEDKKDGDEDGMEVKEKHRSDSGMEQVANGDKSGDFFALSVAEGKSVERDGAQSQSKGLTEKKPERVRVEPVERNEGEKDRAEMVGEKAPTAC